MKHIRESLQELLHRHEQRLQSRTLLELGAGGQHWPLQVVHLGSQDPVAPRVFVVGGIHGNERIGVDVVMAGEGVNVCLCWRISGGCGFC